MRSSQKFDWFSTFCPFQSDFSNGGLIWICSQMLNPKPKLEDDLVFNSQNRACKCTFPKTTEILNFIDNFMKRVNMTFIERREWTSGFSGSWFSIPMVLLFELWNSNQTDSLGSIIRLHKRQIKTIFHNHFNQVFPTRNNRRVLEI